jgi:chromosome segregation ATPase
VEKKRRELEEKLEEISCIKDRVKVLERELERLKEENARLRAGVESGGHGEAMLALQHPEALRMVSERIGSAPVVVTSRERERDVWRVSSRRAWKDGSGCC